MGFAAYLKHSLWDYLLCVCASSALCYTCLIAFVATHPFQEQPFVVIGACAVLCAILFCIAYSSRTALVGSVLLAVAACGATVACWAGSGAPSLFDDIPANSALLVIEIVLCAVLVFVCSRKKVPTLVLLVGGLVMCCAMEYLYWDHQVVSTLLFGVASATLYAYRVYQQGLAHSDADRLMFGSATAAGAVMSIAAVLLAVGVFALVIAPLNPPNLVVKLLTRHVQLQEVEVRGVGDELSVQNSNLLSLNEDGTVSDSNGNQGMQDDPQQAKDDQTSQHEQAQGAAGASFDLKPDSEDETASPLAMRWADYLPVIVVLLVLVAIAAVIAVRKLLRRRRLARIRALPNSLQVQEFFRYFMGAFAKLKVAQPAHQTLREFSLAAASSFASFEQADSVEFPGLVETYSSCFYGRYEPTDDEADVFADYYRSFFGRACAYVGRLRYMALFFRI